MVNSKDMYHYTECGLDNVYLANGVDRNDTDYGPTTSIHNVEGLHLCIARSIAECQVNSMTGREFRFLRVFLNLSQKSFGALHGVTDQAVAKWEKRVDEVPQWANNYMRAVFREKVNGNAELMSTFEKISALEREINGLESSIQKQENLLLSLQGDNNQGEWVAEKAAA